MCYQCFLVSILHVINFTHYLFRKRGQLLPEFHIPQYVCKYWLVYCLSRFATNDFKTMNGD